MCELTFCSLNDPIKNALAGLFLTRKGSEKHDDGTGFMTLTEEWKTHLQAKIITNLGSIFGDFAEKEENGNAPIAFHIRSATMGIKVTKENAHPFRLENGRLTLMHNGSLKTEDANDDDGYYWNRSQTVVEKDSDSLEFLKVLEEEAKKLKNFDIKLALENAMKRFTGKFAFIIREDTGKNAKFYIVRGKTAELWITYAVENATDEQRKALSLIKDYETLEKFHGQCGYVVNTNKDTLAFGLLEYKNVWELQNGNRGDVYFTPPVLLPEESIFVAEENCIKFIGKLEERHHVVAKKSEPRAAEIVKASDPTVIKSLELATRVSKWLKENFMDLGDFQILVALLFGCSVVELTEEKVNEFIKVIIPKITPSKKIKAKMESILKSKKREYVPKEIFEDGVLSYPWTVNSGKDLEEVFSRIKSL